MKAWQDNMVALWEDAWEFPLELRIAYKLHSEGVKFSQMNEYWKNTCVALPEPIFVKIENYIRDLERGFYNNNTVKFWDRLKHLSKKL